MRTIQAFRKGMAELQQCRVECWNISICLDDEKCLNNDKYSLLKLRRWHNLKTQYKYAKRHWKTSIWYGTQNGNMIRASMRLVDISIHLNCKKASKRKHTNTPTHTNSWNGSFKTMSLNLLWLSIVSCVWDKCVRFKWQCCRLTCVIVNLAKIYQIKRNDFCI